MPVGATETELERKIQARTATVGIIGLGYVGLPLVRAFGDAGFPVLGFDVDPAKVASLEENRSYIAHIDASIFERLHAEKHFSATSDFGRLAECDAILICVPTPLTEHREPDLQYVRSTACQIAAAARPGQLVVLESTTYPGTTEEILQPAIEGGGLLINRDFFLAFSPEREDPNNPRYTTRTIPKIVGGVTAESGRLAAMLYRSIVDRVVSVTSARVAEATKLVENVFRAVNIAMVNELKVCFDRMDIDVWEVLDAAATKPFGFMKFEPGPGLGGHCIPVDPFYLAWKAREFGVSTRFIELAGEINTTMPLWVIGKLSDALNDRGRALKGSKILIIGVAYKKNVDDVRESPALEIIELLLARGAEVSYHDPLVPKLGKMRKHDLTLQSVRIDETAVRASDAIVIVTDHDAIDYHYLERATVIVDTRNALRKRGICIDPTKVISA
jgi:UDP-N-acetyl-D-glucosamine dehydrogenase